MNVVLFGATGMVGQGVLRECLLDPHVERVLSIGRSATGQHHAKLREIVRPDLFDLSTLESELVGFDACFFCLGVSSAGMAEESYRRVTYDLTMAAARTLSRLNPQMTFVYVSGAGTDSTGRGRTMWARVKGQTENDLLRLPFRAAYMFRPAGIQPLHGVTSRTMLYRIFYAFTRPLFPLLKALFPRFVTTTERVGRAMIEVARHGPSKAILETDDINRIGALPLVSSRP
ncbi:MAG: epimerase [Thermoanaerobaculia bacterium]